MQDDKRGVDPCEPPDQREHTMPEWERIARIEATTPKLVHDIHRVENRHLVELANPGEMEQRVPADDGRGPPDDAAESQPPDRNPYHGPEVAALEGSRSSAQHRNDAADRDHADHDDGQGERATGGERQRQRQEHRDEAPGERSRKHEPEAPRPVERAQHENTGDDQNAHRCRGETEPESRAHIGKES